MHFMSLKIKKRHCKQRRHINKAAGRQNIIGAHLGALRYTLGPQLTQQELADRVSVGEIKLDRTAIAKIEAGTRVVKDFELRAIAQALKTDVDTLFK